jgi:hypothetical protein
MKSKYKTIIMKEELHAELDYVCRKRGLRTTTELLKYFLKMEYEMNERIKNELFNDGEEFNPYHNLNEQYKNKKNENK